MQAGGREFESLYLHLLSKESRTLYLENCIYETSKNTLNVDRDENEALRKQRTKRNKPSNKSRQILTLWYLKGPSNKERRADALALRADERRDKLR